MLSLFVLGCVSSGNYNFERLADNSNYNSNSGTSQSAQQSPKLELLSYRGDREYDFMTVHGLVKNISSEKLENVEAVVEFYEADGSFVKSEDSLIKYNPILPGQTSPFEVGSSDNPAIKRFKVTFKDLMGGTIPSIDSSPPEQPKGKKHK
jgi:hypothetical protein